MSMSFPSDYKRVSPNRRNSSDDVWKVLVISLIVVASISVIALAGWGISVAVKTYSYTTVELGREAPFDRQYHIEREYRAAYTEVYYTTDSEGKRHRRTRHHDAEYYFRYDGYRHHVRKSVYDSPVTTAVITYQTVTYKRVPNYPDYPNKVDENPYKRTIAISDVAYR